MGLLADWQIRNEIPITPFEDGRVRPGVISYGLSSYGYDVRVGRQFKIFHNAMCSVVDPKNFDESSFIDFEGDVCLIPPNSFVLAMSVEHLVIPRDVLAVCIGKSSYARCGIVVNVTPLEPCLSADSEILTEQGWVGMDKVKVGDSVLTRRDDGIAEYQLVEKKQSREYVGPMLHFVGRSIDQLVTPDHKLLVWLRNSRQNSKSLRLLEASHVFGKENYSFDRTVRWRGDSPATIDVCGRQYQAGDFLDFLGCWLGDGSAYHGSDGGYHVKLAVVTKDKKRSHFKKVLESLGIKAALRERGFEFFDKKLAMWLWKFGHAKDKYIDRSFFSLSPSLLCRLMDGLMASDGCQQTQTYTTVSKQLADDVQVLAYLIGKAAVVRRIPGGQATSMSASDSYKVRVCGVHMTPKIPPSRHRVVPYDGMVYDVTVPNHVFFCRRNGKASWTGNCWKGHVTIEISNTTPLPAKIYAGEGIMQILFLRGELGCDSSYADKKSGHAGKYQDQDQITLPRVD